MSTEIDTAQQGLDLQLRKAELLSQADMAPEKFKGKPANVLMAQELAHDMGESLWVTMTELYFVGNVPTFSAKYMRSRVRAAGHILRESYDPKTTTATCVIIRKDDPGFEHVVTWDKQKASDHGLWGKGHWKKNPELMLKNRAVSECVREACNEVMGGVSYTAEEAEAMQPVKASATRMDEIRALAKAPVQEEEPEHEPNPILAEIEQATDKDWLNDFMTSLPEDQKTEEVLQAGRARYKELG